MWRVAAICSLTLQACGADGPHVVVPAAASCSQARLCAAIQWPWFHSRSKLGADPDRNKPAHSPRSQPEPVPRPAVCKVNCLSSHPVSFTLLISHCRLLGAGPQTVPAPVFRVLVFSRWHLYHVVGFLRTTAAACNHGAAAAGGPPRLTALVNLCSRCY